jgi:hypothetical protein
MSSLHAAVSIHFITTVPLRSSNEVREPREAFRCIHWDWSCFK